GYSGIPLSPFFSTFGLGREPRPFAVPINKSLAVAATTVGYHCVGMNPFAELFEPATGLLISNTATESEIAFAVNNVFSSADNVIHSGSLPPYFCPGNFVERE